MRDDLASDDPSPRDPPAFRSDTRLLAGVAARQPAALAELYDRYFPSASALAVRMLHDAAAAEACVQTVFLDLGQHPPSTAPPPRDWSAVLLAAVQRQARMQQRSPLRPPPPPSSAAPPWPTPRPAGRGGSPPAVGWPSNTRPRVPRSPGCP